MNARKVQLSTLCFGVSLLAQACVQYESAAQQPPPPEPPPYTADSASAPPGVPPSPAIDTLVAPIALYPDPLLAIILPASTVPWEVTAASAYLVQYGDVSRIGGQPWDPSVRALAHYPTLLAWMAANIEWTRALGSAFAASPADVMDSVQRLRARALAAGTLASTSQQQVLSVEGEIVILPGQPDTVYIPAYDPGAVYSDEPYEGFDGPFINFGEAFDVGAWLSYSIDWRHHRVWSGDHNGWHEHRGWQPPHFDPGHGPSGARQWQPRQAAAGGAQVAGARTGAVPVPRLMAGAPNPPPARHPSPAKPPGQASRSPGGAVPVPRTAATPAERPRLGAPPQVNVGSEKHSGALPEGGEPHSAAPELRYDQPQGAIPAPRYNPPPAAHPAPPPVHSAPPPPPAPASAPASNSASRDPSK